MTPHPRTHTLELPYDKPPLTANQRHHWAQRARLTANVRRATHLLARHHQLPQGCRHATVRLHYQPRDNRRRDPSNLMPTQKACLDALSAGTKKHPGYGLVPDDNPAYVDELMPVIHDADRTPRTSRLWLEVTVHDR